MTNATTTPKTTLRPIAPEAWETTARARARQQGEPDWALEQRRIAAAQAKALGLPSREHELWRRIDFRTLEQGLAALDPFHAGPAAATFGDLPAGLRAVLGEDADRAGVLVQRDAGVAFERNAAELERQGVIVCSLERALTRHAELLRPRLGALIEPDYDGYAA
ncbi:MAG: hypothetical protein DMD83_22480, partial [Candidatus Rokuibacteriota bacterium]